MPRYIAGNHRGYVYCNGALLNGVLEVDTDLGFAIVAARDANGVFIAEGDEVRRTLVLGTMQFIMAES